MGLLKGWFWKGAITERGTQMQLHESSQWVRMLLGVSVMVDLVVNACVVSAVFEVKLWEAFCLLVVVLCSPVCLGAAWVRLEKLFLD